MTDDTTNGSHWYHEPLAWLVIGIPASAILACFLMISIASRSPHGMVVDDYYKRGLEINKVLSREQRAAELGLELGAISLADGRLRLKLESGDLVNPPEALPIALTHATRAGEDQNLEARHQGEGRYLGMLAPVVAGPWYVEAATPEWRLVKRVLVPLPAH